MIEELEIESNKEEKERTMMILSQKI